MSWINPVKEIVTGLADGYKAKQENKTAVVKESTRLITDVHSNNTSWEINALKVTGKGLKWASFGMFAGPIMLTVVGPFVGLNAEVDQMWANFEKVPDKWMVVYASMTGAIWGISALKDAGVSLTGMIKQVVKR